MTTLFDDRHVPPGLEDSLRRLEVKRNRWGKWLPVLTLVAGFASGAVGMTFRAGHFVAQAEEDTKALHAVVAQVNDRQAGLDTKQPAREMPQYVTRAELDRALADLNKKVDGVDSKLQSLITLFLSRTVTRP